MELPGSLSDFDDGRKSITENKPNCPFKVTGVLIQNKLFYIHSQLFGGVSRSKSKLPIRADPAYSKDAPEAPLRSWRVRVRTALCLQFPAPSALSEAKP